MPECFRSFFPSPLYKPGNLPFLLTEGIPAYLMGKQRCGCLKLFLYLHRKLSIVCKGIFRQIAEKFFLFLGTWLSSDRNFPFFQCIPERLRWRRVSLTSASALLGITWNSLLLRSTCSSWGWPSWIYLRKCGVGGGERGERGLFYLSMYTDTEALKITWLRTKAFRFLHNFVKDNWHGILRSFVPQNVARCLWH